MNYRRKIAGVACIVLVIMFSFPLVAGAQPQRINTKMMGKTDSNKTGKVVIVSMPRVSWYDLQDVQTPNIDKLINSGSIANLSIMVPGKTKTLEKGYATISSGVRTYAADSTQSTFFSPNENVDGKNARQVFQNEQQTPVGDSKAVSLGFELTRTNVINDLSSATVGLFAQTLHEHNKSIAVYGNADTCEPESMRCRNRSVGYMGVNTNGLMRSGDISRELLDSNGSMNMKKVENISLKSIKNNDVTVVECSDLDRIDGAAKETKQTITQANFKKAIQECDDLIGAIDNNLDTTKDNIYVVSPMSKRSLQELTVFIAAGKGVKPGVAVSGITRRKGIVALADIAPTILDSYGIEPPKQMVSTLIEYDGSSASTHSRIQSMIKLNRGAVVRDKSFQTVAVIFVSIVFLGALFYIFSYKLKKGQTIAKLVALFSLLMPTVSFLLLPFMIPLNNTDTIAAVFVILSCIFTAVAFFVAKQIGYVKTLLAIVLFNVIFQCIDMLFAGYFQLNSLFGYSAIVAGRFAGYGNLTFSIIAISTVICVALIKQYSIDQKYDSRKTNLYLVVFMITVLIFVGAPYLGSDVGGVLALTPTIFISSMMLYEKRINIKALVLAGFGTLIAITIFSLFDLARPASERTHLGRFVKVLLSGDGGAVIERKITSNLSMFSNSLFGSFLIIGSLIALYLYLNPEKFLTRTRDKYPVFVYIAYPGLVLAVLGMLLNDSGIAIPGMMASIALPVLALLAFEVRDKQVPQHDKEELSA